jgi:hypothetical protein
MGLGSGIREKPIPDPGSRGQKGTGSRIRIRNTEELSTGPVVQWTTRLTTNQKNAGSSHARIVFSRSIGRNPKRHTKASHRAPRFST